MFCLAAENDVPGKFEILQTLSGTFEIFEKLLGKFEILKKLGQF